MIFTGRLPERGTLRSSISAAYLSDEVTSVKALLPLAKINADTQARIAETARRLVVAMRENNSAYGGMDAFLSEYDLSTQEGVLLMCLAEALLRIPDSDTADSLIRDKLAKGRWDKHLGRSESLFVNASTWGLMLTGKIVRLDSRVVKATAAYVDRLLARAGEPVIRMALTQAMKIMSHQFVMGRTITEALERSRTEEQRYYLHSYDMLGEAALSDTDAERYYRAYEQAIASISQAKKESVQICEAPSVSIKLSALHPRFEFAQRQRVMNELIPKLHSLTQLAKAAGIGLTLDTEEADRLELTLDVFEAVYRNSELTGWEGFGIAVQAYQKRALPVLDWLQELAQTGQRPIAVRLVKGAYWDTEIKRAQERGLVGYPVYTRKDHTDVSYLVCAKKMIAAGPVFFPQFATHNAHTAAAVMTLAHDQPFEMQRLHGMGEALYGEILRNRKKNIRCRVYAPVGSHAALLPYLVRRLLENGANTSFINRAIDAHTSIASIIADPAAKVRSTGIQFNAQIPLPTALYGNDRRNSMGVNLNDETELKRLAHAMETAMAQEWEAAPLIGGDRLSGRTRPVLDPSDNRNVVGMVAEADTELTDQALSVAVAASLDWERTPVDTRAHCLERTADLFEQYNAELAALCVREAGKCIPDAFAEIREAVDYCRYYAYLARGEFAAPQRLIGPTGESNDLAWRGRGVFVCISPWNFPLAIFVGQVVAALVAGNTVIAKPASHTPLVAARAVALMHQAGVPPGALNLLPGSSAVIGSGLIADDRVAGVALTGATETAYAIHSKLAAKGGKIVPLIAETGGLNAMIVDSSALPEQVVADVVLSAFNSAGQRCSALRVLFLQDEIADSVITLLSGALAQQRIGDPALLATDIGPVIDAAAKTALEKHVSMMREKAKLVYQLDLPPECGHGNFFPPCVFEMGSMKLLRHEVFGPILHVVRYAANKLDHVIDAIHATGYGLTLGIHSRIEDTVKYISHRARVGNIYVNRNMVGAMVGVQPFGGEGLSGTGPKAGGPHYLHGFATERSLSINTTAVGGNARLLSLDEENGGTL